jgi:hypothetical protein
MIMKTEYAITAGPGTLIDYGTTSLGDRAPWKGLFSSVWSAAYPDNVALNPDFEKTLIIGPADEDCVTGQ